MRAKINIVLLLTILTVSGCSFAPQRPTAAPIYVTATPVPTDIPEATPTPAMTAVLGATLAAQDATANTGNVPTAAAQLATTAAPFAAHTITQTPSFTITFTDSPVPKGTNPTLVSCTVPPQGGFATIYTQDTVLAAQLGCPVSSAVPIQSATLSFQNGSMVWASQYADIPGKVIYALFNNGTYQRVSDVWTEGVNPESTGDIAPAGLNAPVRGFGKIWHENASIKNGLGWATNTEVGTGATIQRFERGEMIFVASVGQTFIFVAGSNTWRLMPVGY